MKIPILTLSSVLMKICQIPHVIFQTTSQFFFKFCMTLQCHEIYLYSLALFQVKCCILCTKGTNQSVNILDLLVLRSKFNKFLSFLKQKVSSSSNFAPLSQCALGYQRPPPKHPTPSFLPSPLFKSTNCPSPPFQAIPSSILVFREPFPKSRIFQ